MSLSKSLLPFLADQVSNSLVRKKFHQSNVQSASSEKILIDNFSENEEGSA